MKIDDITSFLTFLFSSMKEEKIPVIYYIVPLIAVLAFFAIRDFVLANKEDLRIDKRNIISNFMTDIVVSMATTLCCFCIAKNITVSIACGILLAIYLTPKISPSNKAKKKKEEKNTTNKSSGNGGNNTNTNNINVVINNNTDDNEKDLLPDFYDPVDLKLPEGISLNQLNIIMILEMYGYIAPNHKFKMITQSLFETPDEQVEKLLKMYVLDQKELREAKAILNLIKLNNRLITKEEALHCILEVEEKQKQKQQEKNKKGE